MLSLLAAADLGNAAAPAVSAITSLQLNAGAIAPEGAVLLAEIDRLRVENCELRGIRLNMGRGINMLRAAIDRVRALHRSGFKGVICDGCAYYYPCLTIRALDGEGA